MLMRGRKRVLSNATIYGKGHKFSSLSNVRLIGGASKKNVILHEFCWPEGQITVEGDGIVEMHPYSKIGPTTKILCVNKVIIGPYTADRKSVV